MPGAIPSRSQAAFTGEQSRSAVYRNARRGAIRRLVLLGGEAHPPVDALERNLGATPGAPAPDEERRGVIERQAPLRSQGGIEPPEHTHGGRECSISP